IAFGARCRQAGVRPSMGSVGDCFDNAMAESFFATLECELLERRSFKTQIEARMAVFDFIEGWCNPHRRHSALGYQSPIDYEPPQETDADQPWGVRPPRASLGRRKRGGRRAAQRRGRRCRTLKLSDPTLNRAKGGAEKLDSVQQLMRIVGGC